MNSSKDKAIRQRLKGKRTRPAPGRIQEAADARARWPYVLALGTVVLLALGDSWIRYRAKLTKGPEAASQPTPRRPSIPSLVEQLKQAEQAKNEEQIERTLLSLVELDRGNSKWLMQICEFYFSQARWSAATKLFTAEIDRNYSPQAAYPLQGTMLNALINFGQPAEARLILDPLLSRTVTKTLEVAQMEARLLRLEGKSLEALELLNGVMPEKHEHEPLYKLKGILEFDLGQYERARASLEHASRLNPYSDSTQFKLAECARLLGDLQAAQQYRQRYAELQSIHQEISRLKALLEQSLAWTDEQALRLAALYESIGQSQQAAFCREQVAARRSSRK